MKRVSKFLVTLLNIGMAFSLAAMVILVFGNVVLRYAFNSGITWSEEMSRYLFIYLCFLGAVGALKDNEHLGVDSLIRRLPQTWKRITYVLSNLIVLLTLYYLVDGSWKMMVLNADSHAPATGIPLSWIYFIGVFISITMGLIIIKNTITAIVDKDAIDGLCRLAESEEEISIQDHQSQSMGGGHS